LTRTPAMSPSEYLLSPEISRALQIDLPLVALESTVITHGLPSPQNVTLARNMEATVREEGAVPATIAVLHGRIRIGLSSTELDELASSGNLLKISQRDFATAIQKSASGGTTVAGTMLAANAAGLKVFATGGIGGVHKEARFDVSTDLQALANTPMIVVCAGAKAILDLPATLEYLETMAVPVVGYQTDEFPAFYSRGSGLKLTTRLDSPEEIVRLALAHWNLGMRSAILVAQPVPPGDEIPQAVMSPWLEEASKKAIKEKIHGQKLTPFLLGYINQLSGGKSLQANLALLLNNARLAAHIARSLSASRRRKEI
jgi:pseudouridine-5'-phosphate glycosidase